MLAAGSGSPIGFVMAVPALYLLAMLVPDIWALVKRRTIASRPACWAAVAVAVYIVLDQAVWLAIK